MSNHKNEYDELIKQRKTIIEELKELETNQSVIRYIELTKQNESTYKQQCDLYRTMKEEEYASCKHILVYSKIDYERYEGRTYRSCGCIKCGLNNSVLRENYRLGHENIMYNYLRKNPLHGIETEITCDLDLAKAIYSKIKEAHPDIDDKMAIKYFEIALDNIRNIKVSDERKASRAKRLSLKPDFKSWNGSDIYND